MNQYQNSYMAVSVEFPDNWSFRYWGNRKSTLANPEMHQASFEELPSENSPHKILFTSLSRFEKSPSILNGVLELVALYRPNGIKLKSEIPPNTSEISRVFGTCLIAGNNSTFLQIEAQ